MAKPWYEQSPQKPPLSPQKLFDPATPWSKINAAMGKGEYTTFGEPTTLVNFGTPGAFYYAADKPPIIVTPQMASQAASGHNPFTPQQAKLLRLSTGANNQTPTTRPSTIPTDAAGAKLPPITSALVDKNGLPIGSSGYAGTSAVAAGSVGQQGPISPTQAQGSAKNVTCGSKGDAVKIGPSLLGISISKCNVKALTGGMVTILGVQMMFLGVVVVGLGLGLKTKTGQQVKNTATKAAKTAVTRKLPKPASATQAAKTVAAPPAPPMTAARTATAA